MNKEFKEWLLSRKCHPSPTGYVITPPNTANLYIDVDTIQNHMKRSRYKFRGYK